MDFWGPGAILFRGLVLEMFNKILRVFFYGFGGFYIKHILNFFDCPR